MNYNLIKDVIGLVQQFEAENRNTSVSKNDIADFKEWIIANYDREGLKKEPDWEGKSNGRSSESAINTLIVHMNRYARSYSRSAIFGSDFSSQEDFIYLITLKSYGEMTKMDLIKKNVHDKTSGMQVINRLIAQGWVKQTGSKTDRRSKLIKITSKGVKCLEAQMDKIRDATRLVAGDLTYNEKMELIRLLNKLNNFHRQIYDMNIDPEHLLTKALKNKN